MLKERQDTCLGKTPRALNPLQCDVQIYLLHLWPISLCTVVHHLCQRTWQDTPSNLMVIHSIYSSLHFLYPPRLNLSASPRVQPLQIRCPPKMRQQLVAPRTFATSKPMVVIPSTVIFRFVIIHQIFIMIRKCCRCLSKQNLR